METKTMNRTEFYSWLKEWPSMHLRSAEAAFDMAKDEHCIDVVEKKARNSKQVYYRVYTPEVFYVYAFSGPNKDDEPRAMLADVTCYSFAQMRETVRHLCRWFQCVEIFDVKTDTMERRFHLSYSQQKGWETALDAKESKGWPGLLAHALSGDAVGI